MKSLIRNPGETIFSTSSIEGIDWTTGAPLTNPSWAGGPYALAQDAPLDSIPSDYDITETEEIITEATEDQPAETIVRRIATLNADRYNARLAGEAQEPAGAPEAPADDAEPAPEVAEVTEPESVEEETDESPAEEIPAEDPEPEQPADDGDETVTINGVTYTKAQLRAIMGE